MLVKQQIRSRRWPVEEVVPSDRPGKPPLARLALVDDEAQGQSVDVCWDYGAYARNTLRSSRQSLS